MSFLSKEKSTYSLYQARNFDGRENTHIGFDLLSLFADATSLCI
jgi:hypothetical protein